MNFSELFIRRPVLSTVVSLLILLLGMQGIAGMTIRQFPKVDETVVTVSTTYPGASAELMQGFVTTPIAKVVSSAEGVDYVAARSALNSSTVTARMRLNTDPDKALTEIIAKVQQVRGELPSEADDPIIQKGTGQSFALMYLAFASDQMNPQQVTEYLTRVIQPRLATIPGVADAQILGAQTFAMRVWIDPIRLAARHLTAAEVVTAIQNSNFLSAPGRTRSDLVAYSIEAQTTLQTPEAFGELPITGNGDEIVRLRDVARVELGSENSDVKVMFNGREGTFIGILPTPAANAIDTAAAVQAALPDIQALLPKGMTGELVYDASSFISASISEVFKTIAEAVAIVVVVILLFLGSFRSVVVPIVTIPLSLVGVCFFLYALGYSINTLTLLAMVLAIGLVVDDAIVVVENIHRHIEEGYSPMNAAIYGMREIFGPVVAMTITLAAVYAPIGFTEGLTGALFREFAFTLAGAVIISGIVAVTLSPMMASRLLKHSEHDEHGNVRGFAGYIDRFFDRLANWYGRRLDGTLKYRPVTLFVVVVLLGTTGFLFMNTKAELEPKEDQGVLFSVVSAPRYATPEYLNAYVKEFHKAKAVMPEIDASFSIVTGSGEFPAFAGWKMVPWGDRDRGIKELEAQMNQIVGSVAGVRGLVLNPAALPGSGDGLPVQMVLRSVESPERVYEVAEEIRMKAQQSGRFIFVQNSLTFETPRVRLVIDRDRAAALGVSVREIGTTLNVLVGEGSVAKFDRDNRSYDIIPQVVQDDRLNPESLGRYFVRSASGVMVPLSAVLKINTDAAPAAIEQFNQLNSATIGAVPLPTVTTADALQVLEDAARQTIPEGFFIDFSGQSRLQKTEGNSILVAFGLAIVVIYLVLAAQFESFRDPLIIMMAVPLSIFGAIVPLNLGLTTINIYTEVGLITLVGLITKHGILMVEFANEQRIKHGLSRRDAILRAATVRLRPILMTTAAMVLGVLPLLEADGAGGAARFSIGLVIASGMSVGTLFTLFVVPMFYTYIAKSDAAMERQREGHGEEAVAHPA
jgi:multidrug efflux pump